MFGFSEQLELIALFAGAYLFLTLVLARYGAGRSCGMKKAFFVSFFLTPVIGAWYVITRPDKSVLKTVHYRCRHCGLEYTSAHRYCRICSKDGHKYRLHRISMRTY